MADAKHTIHPHLAKQLIAADNALANSVEKRVFDAAARAAVASLGYDPETTPFTIKNVDAATGELTFALPD